MRKWMITSITVAAIAASALFLRSQNPPKLGWDQPATDLAEAQSFAYKYYLDGATTGGATLPTVTCTGTSSPFLCTSPIPVVPQGRHTLKLTASSADAESAQSSTSVSFTIPATPQNLRKQ